MKSYIVVNDFRALPIVAVFHMARNLKKKGPVEIIYAERFLSSNEYGEKLPKFYKSLKVRILKLFFKTKCIASLQSSSLQEQHKLGINSSLQSITCDSLASSAKYSSLYKTLVSRALGADEIVQYLVGCNHQKKVFIFNGRTASSGPIVRACTDNGIPLYYYEYASGCHGYRLFPFPPHNSKAIGRCLWEFRTHCIISVPQLFIKGKVFAKSKLHNEFTKRMNLEPEQKHDVIIFLGSDHEYTNIQEDICNFSYIGNMRLVKKSYEKYEGKDLAVRAHPNQSNDPSHYRILAEIKEFCEDKKITFYGPESPVSSITLMKQCDVVVVEYSSIAYDAIILGKEVDIFGDLDVKEIINLMPDEMKTDPARRSLEITQTLALMEWLFVQKFNKLEYFICRILSLFEGRILKSHIWH